MPVVERKPGHCGLCIARCGSIAVVEDGRFVALEPDPSQPTGQALCAKGRAAPELVNHPDRLLHPMKRTRPKGDPDPGWQRITWDEALDATAAALRAIADRHGPQAVAFSRASGSCTATNDAGGWITRLMHAFGGVNMMNNVDICGWGRGFATRYTYGVGSVGTGGAGGAMPDIDRAGCLILWGYNPSMSRLTHATAIVAALKRGMKLIVVDPRQVGLANKADLWLRVRPGSDGALALGIAGVMIARGWFDRDFLRDWSNGPLLVREDTGSFLRLAEIAPGADPALLVAWDAAADAPLPYDPRTGRYQGDVAPALDAAPAPRGVPCRSAFARYAALCAEWTPRRVAETCWIAADQVEAAARLIWQARPTAYYAWSGHEQHTNTTQTARAISLLYALTGCFDAPGGNVLLPGVKLADIAGPAPREPALGLAERPLGPSRWNLVSTEEIYRGVLEGTPYRIAGLVSFGGNMLLSHADGRRGRAAMAALDFAVHADLFMNPSAELADIVLPAASPFETEALRPGFEVSEAAQARVQLRQPVVPPRGEARSDTRIAFDLACRLGLGDRFWDGDIEAGLRHQLAPSGLTPEALRAEPAGIDVALRTRHRKHAEPDAAGNAQGFATPTCKVEVYAEGFLVHGQAPLPGFEEPLMGQASRPELAGDFPLVLTSAKHTLFCESQHRNLPSLRRNARDPELELHPSAAAARGIAGGDWVEIATPRGRVRARAALNPSLHPRVACGQHGWWQACAAVGAPGYDPFAETGANLNLLIGSDLVDPVSGTQPLKSYLCEVRRLPARPA
ncbi:molybdopterin-containing oxidoreductase family protein [Falsiroseomonas oryzae]|uniref:molybdopterin-containing oxidoreductase family protein n=1 Tax=Falsiroseomonas oryzae TaxID=2766473 RepID=UPI0022EA19B9|nr:molybdopterin-dependent oxidoreductase [Roseomonas sp. MO-31]